MAELRAMIKGLEDHFHIKVYGRIDERREISDVRLLSEAQGDTGAELDRFILYLGRYDELTQAPFHQNCVLAATPELPQNYSALYTPAELDLTQAARFIREQIVRRDLMKLKREELFNTLYQGGGLQSILQTAYGHLENVITVCDSSFKVLSAVPERAGDIHFDGKSDQLYLSDSYVKNMLDSKTLENIYHSNAPYRTTFKDSDQEWLFCGVRVRSAVVGYVCVFSDRRPIRDGDAEYVQALAQVVSVELQKQDAFRAPTGKKYEYFLSELLSGHLHRPAQIAQKLSSLGFKPQKYCSVMMIGFEDRQDMTRAAGNYYEKILAIVPRSMAVLFHGYITVLFTHSELEQFPERVLNRLSVFLAFNGLRAAVSYPFEDVCAVSRFVRQAEVLLSLEGLPADQHNLLCYFQHAPAHILDLLHSQINLEDTIHPIIHQLERYDKENNTEYLHTLSTFINCNRNAQETARELHIHKSTFFYRLNRAAELFDIDVNDHLQMFLFEYSLYVMRYLNGMDRPGT